MRIYSDERLINLGIVSGTVSRDMGSARDPQNVAAVLTSLGIDPKTVFGLKQVHGTEIIDLITDKDLEVYKSAKEHIADGWLLGKSGCGVIILTADCAPLYMWDSKGSYVSLTHCGWRGVVGGMPSNAAQALRQKVGPDAKLCAYIGPHIGKCCFEVKEDVSCQFSESSVIRREGKIFVDLDNEIILQLAAAGVKREDVKTGCRCTCTFCNKDEFFSYRRDKTKDVLMSFVYKI